MVSLRAFGIAALSATLVAASPMVKRQNETTPFCSGKAPGVYQPANNSIISQEISDDYPCNNVTILYCSGQYFKTSSIDTSVWLSQPGSTSGELLAKDVSPDNQDAQAGFYSYQYNVTICPIDGEYQTGPFTLTVYETESGYYNAENYETHAVNVNLATSGEICDDGPRCG